MTPSSSCGHGVSGFIDRGYLPAVGRASRAAEEGGSRGSPDRLWRGAPTPLQPLRPAPPSPPTSLLGTFGFRQALELDSGQGLTQTPLAKRCPCWRAFDGGVDSRASSVDLEDLTDENDHIPAGTEPGRPIRGSITDRAWLSSRRELRSGAAVSRRADFIGGNLSQATNLVSVIAHTPKHPNFIRLPRREWDSNLSRSGGSRAAGALRRSAGISARAGITAGR